MQLSVESTYSAIDIWWLMNRRKRFVIGLPISIAIVAAIISLFLPNIYRSEVLVSPVSLADESPSNLGALGGLTSLVGLSISSGGNKQENLAVLKSREFVWNFIREESLLPILFADDWDEQKSSWVSTDSDDHPTMWDAYRLFTKDVMRVSDDKQSGLVTISVDWTNPELSAKWANLLIGYLNEYLRQQAIVRAQTNLAYLNDELSNTQVAEMRETLFHLIAKEQRTAMIASTQKQFAFQVLDSAAAPDKKNRPNRLLIVLFVGFASGVIIFAFILIRFILFNQEVKPKSE